MKKTNSLRKGPFMLMALFTAFILIGIAVGEPSRVLEMARAICLSCIGIG